MALVLSAAQMRAVDKAAIETLGVPGLVLMENAGRGVAALIGRERAAAGRDVRVVCGVGQNGGDGFVIARHLANAGARVTALLAAPRARITGDAAVFAAVVERMPGITVRDGSDPGSRRAWRRDQPRRSEPPRDGRERQALRASRREARSAPETDAGALRFDPEAPPGSAAPWLHRAMLYSPA